MQQFFLARQPILDRNQSLCAFELLFRSGNKPEAGMLDDTHATAQVYSTGRNLRHWGGLIVSQCSL